MVLFFPVDSESPHHNSRHIQRPEGAGRRLLRPLPVHPAPRSRASHRDRSEGEGTRHETDEPRERRGHEKRPPLHPEALPRRQIRELFAGLIML